MTQFSLHILNRIECQLHDQFCFSIIFKLQYQKNKTENSLHINCITILKPFATYKLQNLQI